MGIITLEIQQFFYSKYINLYLYNNYILFEWPLNIKEIKAEYNRNKSSITQNQLILLARNLKTKFKLQPML